MNAEKALARTNRSEPAARPASRRSLYRLFEISFVVYALVFGAIIGAVAWQSSELQGAQRMSALATELVSGAGDLMGLANNERVVASPERMRQQWSRRMRALRSEVDQLNRHPLPAEYLDATEGRLDSLDRALADYLQHATNDDLRQSLLDNVMRETGLLGLTGRQIGEHASREAGRRLDAVVLSVIAGAGMMIVMFLVVGWLAHIWVAKPVVALSQSIAGIGDGRLDGAVPDVSLLELNRVVAALNSLKQRLAETMVSRDELAREAEQRGGAERALLQSEARHRRLVDSISALIVEINREGRIVFANEAMRALTARPLAEVVGAPWQQVLVIANPFRELNAAIRAMARGSDVLGFVMHCLSRDGLSHTIEWNTANEYDQRGRLQKIVALGIDITARRRAEDSLRKSSLRLRAAQEVARIGDWDFDVATRQANWSPELYRLFRRDSGHGPAWPEELLGLCVDCIERTPGCPARPPDCLRRWTDRKERIEVERRVELPDGTVAWHANTVVVSRDANGRVVNLHGTVQDVTERRKTEASLRQSEARFRALVMASSDLVYRMSADWSEMRELAGRQGAKDLERNWLHKYIPADEQPRVTAAIRQAIRSRSMFALEHWLLREDGSVGWTLSRAVPITGPDGNVVEWFGAFSDLTARRQVEQEIEDLYQNAPCGYFSADGNGRIVRINNTLLAWLGYARDEVVGRLDASDLMTPASAAAHGKGFLRLRRDGGIIHSDPEFVRENGTVLPVLLSATSIRDAQNRFLRSRSIVIDISHKKIAEKQRLEHAQQLAELSRQMVAVQEEERRRLARELHDRTSPNLVAVGVNLKVIARKMTPQMSQDVGARLADTHALLDDTIANIRHVTADLHPATLAHAGLLRALEEYGRQFARRTGIDVRVRGPSGEPDIADDKKSALFRIAQEALTNCAKHSHASSATVTLTVSQDGVYLSIEDDGVGFDPAAHGTGKSQGLGLLSMRERAQFAGGRFSFSARPGAGTRVSVRMPLQP
jgi:PAS domain S-box-containing protein